MAKAKKAAPKPAKATTPAPATSTTSTTLAPQTTPAFVLGAPQGIIGGNLQIAYGRGKPWADINRHDPFHITYGLLYGVPPQMLKAMEVIESGGQSIPNGNGYPNYGVMQLTHSWNGGPKTTWETVCAKLGLDFKRPEGQIATAAYVLGGKNGDKGTPEDIFLAKYYPIPGGLDAKGPDGHTQRQYLNDMHELMRQIDAAAGTPATTTTPAPAKVTPADVLRVILGGKQELGSEFAFGGYNVVNGVPQNFYDYAPGHGQGLVAANQHPGVDIFIPLGTTLYTPLPGVVRCVGAAGSPDWGQGCGAYNDTITYGTGNITILTDAGLKLVFGHVNKALVIVGQRVAAGQPICSSGGMLSPHVHLEAAINAPERVNTAIARYPGGYWMVDPLPAIADAITSALNDTPQETRPMVRFAGTSVDVPLSVPLRIVLLPTTQKNQRPGTKMAPDRFIVHETDNQGVGADAASHLRWLQRGAPDDYGRSQQLGFHLVVDENEVIQMIPFDEIAWHGGDSGGACNMRGLSIEITVANKNANKAKIRANAEEVVAAAMLAKSLVLMERHGDCCARIGNPAGCHTRCPATMQADGYWPTFRARVDSWRFGATPTPQYATALPPPEWDGTDKTVNGITFWAAERVYTAKQDGVPALKYADRNSTPVRAPLKKGEAFTGQYLLHVADEQWIVTPFGTRIPAELCTPLVTVKE